MTNFDLICCIGLISQIPTHFLEVGALSVLQNKQHTNEHRPASLDSVDDSVIDDIIKFEDVKVSWQVSNEAVKQSSSCGHGFSGEF